MLAHIIRYSALLTLIIPITFLIPGNAEAHCDSMDGPVVLAAKEALETGNIDHVLIWVTGDQEDEIRASFQQALKVRKINEEVREMADRYFFETLVRLHREAEGAAYSGLKPAGTDFGPAIPAAEKALEDGSLKEVRDLLVRHIEQGLHHYFDDVSELKDFNPANVEKGRAYVNAYVKYMHYVEPLYRTATAEVSHNVGGHDHHDYSPN